VTRYARQISGYLFFTGNAALLVFNYESLNLSQMAASLMLMLCSVLLIFSNRNIRWLYACGALIVTAYALIAHAADGDGRIMQIIGVILPMANGLLLIRSAWQADFKTRFTSHSLWTKPLALIDAYPVAGAGLIQIPGTGLICAGAVLSGDWTLAFSACMWILAALFMAWSDPALPHNHKKN